MVAGEAIVSREESPGSVEQRQSLTATGGDPRESATETIPPGTFVVSYETVTCEISKGAG